MLYGKDIVPDAISDYNNILSDINYCNYNQTTESISINKLRERAILMGSVEWTPCNDIPNNLGYFVKGSHVVGLPYSSVKELQKFIGLDVSIYTFLTAVNNPYSLLYTEDVALGNPCYLGGKYNGKNCHTFYGTVCSSFTGFCYGENNNYITDNYRNNEVPYYYLKPDQSVQALEAGDLFWCPGHVALITDVKRNTKGNVKNIELFESAGDKVSSKIYSPQAFEFRVAGSGKPNYKAYIYGNKLIERSKPHRMDEIEKNNIKEILKNQNFENNEICTWFGDRPCMGEWDKLMINFNKGEYDRIYVYKNDLIIDTLDISKEDHSVEYKFMGVGIYQAHLASDSTTSKKFTSFEVIDTSYEIVKKDDGIIEVLFPENSNPEIVYWVDKRGYQYSYPLTLSEKEKLERKMTVKDMDKDNVFLRVIYRGEYGRAINRPDHLIR